MAEPSSGDQTLVGPPVPKQRTKFNIPLDDGDCAEIESKRSTPPPRPPPPRSQTVTPSPSIHESTPPTIQYPQLSPPVAFVENRIYLELDTLRSLDPSLSAISPNHMRVSPKARPAPPPPPPPIGWTLPAPPMSPPPPPIPPVPPRPPSLMNSTPSPPSVPPTGLGPSTSCLSIETKSTESDDIIELADILDTIADDSMVADGHLVCYAGWVTLQCEKKKKRTHARLRNSTLTFYSDEETDASSPMSGPFNVHDAVLVSVIGYNLSLYFHTDSDVTLIRFTPEEQFENWILMLGESLLAEVDLLRGSIREWTSLGKAWTRRGVGAEWRQSMIALHEHSLYSLETQESLYITDLRKVISLKTKLDKSEWCPSAKRKGQEGPILLTLEGSSLAIEAELPACTKELKEAVEIVLKRAQTTIDNCRLSSGGVPLAIEKCISFISAHGLDQEGLYRKNGNKSKEKTLLKALLDDPINVHLGRESDECVFAVADVLRQFFRKMESPLIPEDKQHDLFQCLAEPDASLRCTRLTVLLESLPEVNYSTLRRLIAHLVEVTANSQFNLASVENVAKVFGPTIFSTDSSAVSDMHSEMGMQIGAVVALVRDFRAIFRETAREAASKAVLEHAKQKTAAKSRADGMLVSVYLWEKENRAFNVQADLCAEEVLIQAFALRDVHKETSCEYALFEVIYGGHLSRRLFSNEKLSSVVLDRWLRWKVSGDSHLKVDKDPYPCSKNLMSPFTGKVRVALDGSRWFQSCELRMEQLGGTIYMCSKSGGKVLRTWNAEELVVYEGSTRKPSHELALTLFPKNFTGTIDNKAGICVHFKLIDARIRFLNNILLQQATKQENVLVHI